MRLWTDPVVRLAALLALLFVASLATPGCTSAPAARHRALEALWKEYRALPDQRALAVAGELRRSRWVAGATGGHATRAGAEAAALRECGERRAKRRMVSPCRLYAVGDEVVWSGE